MSRSDSLLVELKNELIASIAFLAMEQRQLVSMLQRQIGESPGLDRCWDGPKATTTGSDHGPLVDAVEDTEWAEVIVARSYILPKQRFT